MKLCRAISVPCVALAIALPAIAQDRTLAKLSHESVTEVTASPISAHHGFPEPAAARSQPLSESTLSRSAARALFVTGDLVRARQLADRAWKRDHRDAEALFVQMETAAMQDDQATMLSAALHLCELGRAAKQDPRIQLAATRVRESAANTPGFRLAVPRLQTLLANSSTSWPELSIALLNAAMDGVPGLDPEALARASGILTDWRMVAPDGRHSLLDSAPITISPNDDLGHASYGNRTVENFQFPDGIIRLPDYLPRRGVYYAVSHFASLVPGIWTVRSESSGTLEIYVDGARVLSQGTLSGASVRGSAEFEVAPGPHRLLAKFAAVAAPLRIAVSPSASGTSAPTSAKLSPQELAYDLAATAYATGQFATAIDEINALPSASDSAALQFLLAQSWTRENRTTPEGERAWNRLLSLAPGGTVAYQALGQRALDDGHSLEAAQFARRALGANPDDIPALETLSTAIDGDPGLADSDQEASLLWSRRLAEHPSCEALDQATKFYRGRKQFTEAASTQQKLQGCAPESLAYAQSLRAQDRHAEAVAALKQLLVAAPLNRSASQMLVRELQITGDHSGAERAAVAWLRIAPNASGFRRLAAAMGSDDPAPATKPFYAPYRRDAAQLMQAVPARFNLAPVLLLNDHVAILRANGSVSLYVHTTTRFSTAAEIEHFAGPDLPHGAEMLRLQTLHPDGTVSEMDLDRQNLRSSLVGLAAGDAVDEEYVVNYAGDGGIPDHPEVFQFVFGRFDEKVLSSRFVVLTPATQADRAVVISSSDAPRLHSRVQGNMLARVWEREEVSVTTGGLALPNASLAIVRVVEKDNGWTVPSDAEHHRRLETIHPGPRFEES